MNGLDHLVPHVPGWLLVMFRLTGLFVLAPMFGSSVVPGRIKVLLAVGLSLCVYPMLLAPEQASAAWYGRIADEGINLYQLGSLVGLELLIGLVIGYGATLPLIGMQIGGRIIDQQMGLGLAGVINPDLDEEAGVVGQFYFMLALAIFLILGGHRVLMFTLLETFHRIPPGGYALDARLLHILWSLLACMFEIAVRVSGPLLCIIFLENVAVGYLMRTVPQINVLSVGFPLKITVGVFLVMGSLWIESEVLTEKLGWVLSGLDEYFRTWEDQ
ncbi:MAG: flagellar biosynthetic protein FliR [Phycisphaeraceae bacterium]|nr:flagellar biosynthetic protein FliR [Phycisphaeraceae bacterium]